MSWADGEFEDAWFGDDRLRQRAIRVCERLAEHPSESSVLRTCRSGGGIPVLFQREGDGGPCVHHDASIRRLAAHPVVLCVQDTTELDYTGKQTAGLGPLNYAATCISMSPRH